MGEVEAMAWCVAVCDHAIEHYKGPVARKIRREIAVEMARRAATGKRTMRSVTEWLADVEEHYGSLDKFPDARTVRVMRQFALNQITEHERILNTISTDPKDPDRIDYDKVFADDIAAAKSQLEKLDMWLGDRGLTP